MTSAFIHCFGQRSESHLDSSHSFIFQIQYIIKTCSFYILMYINSMHFLPSPFYPPIFKSPSVSLDYCNRQVIGHHDSPLISLFLSKLVSYQTVPTFFQYKSNYISSLSCSSSIVNILQRLPTVLQTKLKVLPESRRWCVSCLFANFPYLSLIILPFIHCAKPNMVLIPWTCELFLHTQLESTLLFKTLSKNTESSSLTWKSNHKWLE